MKNPFKKAEKKDERLKLFIYGDSGAGKTFLSLQFPAPAVIDTERGTVPYNSLFDFHVLNSSSIQEVEEAIEFLKTEKHDFRTLIIDPLTCLWESLQAKWSDIFFKHNKKSKGFKSEFYEFQTKDWMLIKEEWKELIRKILSLDLNIVCTARQKDKYSFSGGDFMTKSGETFDAEKNSIYHFDTVIKLQEAGNKRIATIIKDRGARLGFNQTILNPTIELFAAAYPNLNSKSEPRRTREQLQAIKECLSILCLQNGDLGKLCEENLGFFITGELTQDQAGKVIEMLNKKIAARVTIKEMEAIETEEDTTSEQPETEEEPANKEKTYGPPAGWTGDYSEKEKPCPQCQKPVKFYCSPDREISKCSGCGVIFPDSQLIPKGEKPIKNKKNKEEKVLCQN